MLPAVRQVAEESKGGQMGNMANEVNKPYLNIDTAQTLSWGKVDCINNFVGFFM
jgi:hypothetical protein